MGERISFPRQRAVALGSLAQAMLSFEEKLDADPKGEREVFVPGETWQAWIKLALEGAAVSAGDLEQNRAAYKRAFGGRHG